MESNSREPTQAQLSNAMFSSGEIKDLLRAHFGPRLIDSRTATLAASAAEAFEPVRRIGGKRGWYCASYLWRLRGVLDLMVGGVGMRKGRRDSEMLRVGDTVDSWRVEALEPNRLLRLSAEMKLPGRAWLEFEVTEITGKSTIRQTAIFEPNGMLGRAYWYLIYPLHRYVFSGMLSGIIQNVGKPIVPAVQMPGKKSMNQWFALGLCLAICLGTAGLGAAWTNLSLRDWYVALEKPSWNPPNWIFGPVWTALYIGMAVSAWLVWRTKGLADARLPLLLFSVQLILNAAWSAFFFGLRNPGLSLADIALLWFAIVATIVAFGCACGLAAILLVPYLAWVSFATALNWSIWRLNP